MLHCRETAWSSRKMNKRKSSVMCVSVCVCVHTCSKRIHAHRCNTLGLTDTQPHCYMTDHTPLITLNDESPLSSFPFPFLIFLPSSSPIIPLFSLLPPSPFHAFPFPNLKPQSDPRFYSQGEQGSASNCINDVLLYTLRLN